MKIPKTLRFMFLNPIPLIVHLTWWFLFATLGVVLDDGQHTKILHSYVNLKEKRKIEQT